MSIDYFKLSDARLYKSFIIDMYDFWKGKQEKEVFFYSFIFSRQLRKEEKVEVESKK